MLRPSRSLLVLSAGALLLGLAAALGPGQGLVRTTRRDFQNPGTLAGDPLVPFEDATSCAGCHGYYDESVEPYARWSASMMAQASRDPIFRAALAIAEQDADFAGDFCWRCHAPNGWVAGRALPTDGSGFDSNKPDQDGVACHFCHRLVDPVVAPENPAEDAGILAALLLPPGPGLHSGQYVIDPEDRRRGPFDLGSSFGFHAWRQSPFHREALLCASCHDVSNPLFTRQADGSYALGALDKPHPTAEKVDQFPVERTYSEWALSDYALGPIETHGRFGGNKTDVSTCQDCHLPDATGSACAPGLGETREDLPLHDFNGANSWVLRAVRALYSDGETGLTDSTMNAALARNVEMLRRSADLTAHLRAGELVARVVNQTGHKLPTGYGEGRRMWLNVRFFDAGGALLEERGAYDDASATLTPDTRVWEVTHGIADDVAQATGLPTGASFHFALNSRIEADNRIPPRGYRAGAFAAAGAPVVGAAYLDEHYWDEAEFAPPTGAVRAEVRLFHQTTTREYIEFLRDANQTTADGQVAYDQWLLHGKSAPVELALTTLDLRAPACPPPLPFGPGRPGSSGTPELAWSGSPSIGGSGFALEVFGGPPGTFAFAFAAEHARRVALPGGGYLFLVQPELIGTAQLDGSGQGTIPVPLAGLPAGSRLYFQVLLRDRAASHDLGATNGLYVELCD